MGFFGDKNKIPRKARYSEKHFQSKIQNFLWVTEEILAVAIAEEGNDQSSADKFTADQKKETTILMAGHAKHYLATSSWRLFLGYPASGNVSSFPYEEIQVSQFSDNNGLNLRFLTKIDDLESEEVFVVQKSFLDTVLTNSVNLIPQPRETTIFVAEKKSWGEGAENVGQVFLAQMAAQQSGSEFADVAVCKSCGFRVVSPHLYPASFFERCHDCLRQCH